MTPKFSKTTVFEKKKKRHQYCFFHCTFIVYSVCCSEFSQSF